MISFTFLNRTPFSFDMRKNTFMGLCNSSANKEKIPCKVRYWEENIHRQIQIKFFLLALLFYCILLFSCSSNPLSLESDDPVNEPFVSEILDFKEIWAYVYDGNEMALRVDFPISDIGYFGAYINNFGALAAVPNAQDLNFFDAKVHLVVVNNHAGMTHMLLSPNYPLRDALIGDLVESVVKYGYDGLQIDFELVLASDKENFLSFLADLSKRLDNFALQISSNDPWEVDGSLWVRDAKSSTESVNAKPIFSIAVPARTRYLKEDAYDYKAIASIVDSVFVMAYDEHWSSGTPGPVASFGWSKNVADYALKTVGAKKLVMGQPFYGRTWGDMQPNRAFFHSGMERQIREFDVKDLERIEGILRFTYTTPLTITAYFDDAQSIVERSQMYKNMGIESTGFWILGQEDPAVWQYLKIK